MYSSGQRPYSQSNNNFIQSTRYNMLQLPTFGDSGICSTSSQNSQNFRNVESSSLSLSSQEPMSCPKSSQNSPSRRLMQLYSSNRENAFVKTSVRNNNFGRTMSSNFTMGEPPPPKDTTMHVYSLTIYNESLAVLTFLTKDLAEKITSLKDTVDKFAKATYFHDFMSEVQSRLEQIDKSFSEKIGAHDIQQTKIAELEVIVREKTVLIENLHAEMVSLRQRQPEIVCGTDPQKIVAALETLLVTRFEQINSKQELRLEKMQRKFQVMLDEKTLKLQNSRAFKVPTVSRSRLTPVKRCSSCISTQIPHPNRSRTNTTNCPPSSLSKCPKPVLNFFYDLNSKSQQTTRRDPNLQRFKPRRVTTHTKAVSVIGSSGDWTNRNWRQFGKDYAISPPREIFEISSSSSSGSSPEVILQRLVPKNDQKEEDVFSGSQNLFEDDDDMVSDDIGRMDIADEIISF